MAALQVKPFCAPSGLSVRRCNPVRSTVRPLIRVNLGGRRASCRSSGCNDGWSSDSARRMWQDYAKAMGTRGFSGGFMFPGGGFWGGLSPADAKEMAKQWAKYMHAEGSSTPEAAPGLPLDVVQGDLKYTLYADVPGLSKSDLSIKLSKDNILSISGTRKPAADEEKAFLVRQRPSGDFERKWTLPEDVDTAAISAKVTEGVLMITLGKKVQAPEVDDAQDIPWV